MDSTLHSTERWAKWMNTHDPSICFLQEIHMTSKNTNRLKVKFKKHIFHANCSQNRAGVAILTSDKTGFKPRKFTSQRRTLHINKLMEKKWKQWQILFSWAPKSLWMVAAATKLKDACSVEGKL